MEIPFPDQNLLIQVATNIFAKQGSSMSPYFVLINFNQSSSYLSMLHLKLFSLFCASHKSCLISTISMLGKLINNFLCKH